MFRQLSITIIAAGAFAIAALAGNGNEHWVGTWGTALHEPDLGVPGLANAGFNNQTLRQIVHTSVGGREVRVRLSTFGSNALVIGAAHIALRSGSAGSTIVPNSDRVLTFGGKPSITIPPGALVLSDPVGLEVPALGDLAISIFAPENTGPATWHFESRQTSYVSPQGDFTADSSLPSVATPVAWFWLAGVEVLAQGKTGAVAALGDSLTDGTQSAADADKRWPDQFAQRLAAQPGLRTLGVLNEGIAGGRLLHDSLGPNGVARFERDVLAQSGVTHVIVQMGNNDVFTINPAEEVTVDQIIQGYRQLIERAHAHGLSIYGCTLTPIKGFLVAGIFPVFSPEKEDKRKLVNTWIRMSGEFDGVIDFDRVLRDPDDMDADTCPLRQRRPWAPDRPRLQGAGRCHRPEAVLERRRAMSGRVTNQLLRPVETEGFAQINPLHFGILREFVRAARPEDLAVVDDVGAIRNAESFANVVVGDEDAEPSRFRSRMIRCSSSTWIGSMPEKGSSRRRKLGSIASERAISTRRRSPPESWKPLLSPHGAEPHLVDQMVHLVRGARGPSCGASAGWPSGFLPRSACGRPTLPAADS